jgi:Na+/H+-dicarboxylate symporter
MIGEVNAGENMSLSAINMRQGMSTIFVSWLIGIDMSAVQRILRTHTMACPT